MYQGSTSAEHLQNQDNATPLQKKVNKKDSIQAKGHAVKAKQIPVQRKRKPTIQAKQKPIAAKNAPIQRKTQKQEKPNQEKPSQGSTKFKEIASSMGDQHGVDTSTLKATHNSSFPASVNAAATIQGNKIDFAPGEDTTSNMKHEIAHYIDNTKNGTPAGDQEINGQKVDTSREKVVDRMVDNWSNGRPEVSLSASEISKKNGVIQRMKLDSKVDFSQVPEKKLQEAEVLSEEAKDLASLESLYSTEYRNKNRSQRLKMDERIREWQNSLENIKKTADKTLEVRIISLESQLNDARFFTVNYAALDQEKVDAIAYLYQQVDDKKTPKWSSYLIKDFEEAAKDRIINPQKINQAQAQTCGVVSIQYLLASKKPRDYVERLCEIYFQGEFNGQKITPEVFTAFDKGRGGMAKIDWLYSIPFRSKKNGWFKKPREKSMLYGVTLPGTIAKWMKTELGAISVRQSYYFREKSLWDALNTYDKDDPKRMVVLYVKSVNCLRFPTHFIVLNKVEKVGNSNQQIRLKYYTWGSDQEEKIVNRKEASIFIWKIIEGTLP